MTAVDEIQAAIEKLNGMRFAGTQGAWIDRNGFIAGEYGEWVCGDARYLSDITLLVTLHNTIDAQLEILQDAIEFFNGSCCDDHGLRGSAPALALARAINRVTS